MKVIRYANPEGELGFAQLREEGCRQYFNLSMGFL